MTKEELEKDFYKYLKDSSDYYDPREPLTERKLLQMWLDCAEPREKQIAELEKKLTEKVTLESLDVVSRKIAELEEAKANLEYLLEGKDNEIDELKKENKVLAQNLEDTEICENGWKNRVKELEAQIEKMKCCYNCKHSRTDYVHCITDKHEKWEMIEK